MSLITILTTISGICGAAVTIIGFVTLILKKPRNWIKKIAAEQSKEDIKEIKDLLQEIMDSTDEQKKSDLALLRHGITSLYFKYKDDKEIPSYAKQDWLSMYERYALLGGNSYIKEITRTMEEDWEEK